MRKSFHPGCSCSQCKRGRGSPFGTHIVRLTHRRARQRAKLELKRTGDVVDSLIVPTPYTD